MSPTVKPKSPVFRRVSINCMVWFRVHRLGIRASSHMILAKRVKSEGLISIGYGVGERVGSRNKGWYSLDGGVCFMGSFRVRMWFRMGEAAGGVGFCVQGGGRGGCGLRFGFGWYNRSGGIIQGMLCGCVYGLGTITIQQSVFPIWLVLLLVLPTMIPIPQP